MEQDKVTKLSDVRKNVWDEDSGGKRTMEQKMKKASFGQWWSAARPKKAFVFWSWVAFIILTMIVGFNWGGWVTGGTAQKMTNDAVVQRLSSICVAQFNQDPQRDTKLKEFGKLRSSWKRDQYVRSQGWATMPFEKEPDRLVADRCAEQILQKSQ